jgi:hypothetical protein
MRQALELALDWIKKQPEETPHSKYDVDTRYVVIREIEASLAPQRTWVGLTMQDVKVIEDNAPSIQMVIFMTEATLKDKNNGNS